MKAAFFPKLAWTGISKNKKLYVPYILTGAGMSSIFYIAASLAGNQAVIQMKGGDTLCSMLSMGAFIIAFFSAIFLFYTNSFLMRRRKKEFGLYDILGMNKLGIGRILIWETLIVGAVSIVGGMVTGVVLSKLSELALVNLAAGEIHYDFSVELSVFGDMLAIYGIIYLLIFLNALRQVRVANPTALIKSENVGEKPPRSNLLLAVVGVVILAAAYFIAVSIKNPVAVLALFFVAAAMVIAATYILFTSGSVQLCRLLKRNKKYYYKPEHFVSVSSMTYRMKRNGAGLASICILATMVLVMLSGSACLYFGREQILEMRYPQDISIEFMFDNVASASDASAERLHDECERLLSDAGASGIESSFVSYRLVNVMGVLEGDTLETDSTKYNTELLTYNDITSIYFIPESDYNRQTGSHVTLSGNDVLVYSPNGSYDLRELKVAGTTYDLTLRNIGAPEVFFTDCETLTTSINPLFVVVRDLSVVEPLETVLNILGEPITDVGYAYRFSVGLDYDEELALSERLIEATKGDAFRQTISDAGASLFEVDGRAKKRYDFYTTFGGLFFLGIMLSAVFLCATVLIIYYKQISEGYEDQSRFTIMQKVGMTKPDIRRTINSQMFTVFLLPPCGAVLHLAFAFPMMRRLLLMFQLTDTRMLILTAAICVAIFIAFYIVVYRITSNAYYSIVSGAKDENQ